MNEGQQYGKQLQLPELLHLNQSIKQGIVYIKIITFIDSFWSRFFNYLFNYI